MALEKHQPWLRTFVKTCSGELTIAITITIIIIIIVVKTYSGELTIAIIIITITIAVKTYTGRLLFSSNAFVTISIKQVGWR